MTHSPQLNDFVLQHGSQLELSCAPSKHFRLLQKETPTKSPKSCKFLPRFRDSSNASDAMLKIRVRLAYPSCGSPKHRCWISIHHQKWRNPSGMQLSTRTLRKRGAFIIIISMSLNREFVDFFFEIRAFTRAREFHS